MVDLRRFRVCFCPFCVHCFFEGRIRFCQGGRTRSFLGGFSWRKCRNFVRK